MSTPIRSHHVSPRPIRGRGFRLFIGFVGGAILVSAALAATAGPQRTFATPRAAADALVAAAAQFDSAALLEILGPGGDDLVSSGDAVLDKKQAADLRPRRRRSSSSSRTRATRRKQR
jgi:hypothetical protein